MPIHCVQRHPDNVNVQHTWMTCLLPSIVDPETSMQEKAVQVSLNTFRKFAQFRNIYDVIMFSVD